MVGCGEPKKKIGTYYVGIQQTYQISDLLFTMSVWYMSSIGIESWHRWVWNSKWHQIPLERIDTFL